MRDGFDLLRATPASADPFPHVVVPGFLSRSVVDEVIADFPKLDMAGLFLPEAADYGPRFARLLADLQGPEMTAIVGEKFGLDLAGRPTLATLRSCCQVRDGRIHADAPFKLATMLLYLNEPWTPQGGRLRLLRSPIDLEDYAAEVSPQGGLMILFKVQANSWHGHHPFVGPRRYLMINWCASAEARDREVARHRLSGTVKKVKRLFGLGKVPRAA